ncbi:MAG TPA: glutathione S-transferase family protein, partial [Wenzhouxiangellaceae bacterium]|nr:glutathione S-transferase family protein [Wenzhouxiangellaceae bacterium]
RMRLLTCTGAPSPRRVTLYLAEKGIELDTVEIDLKSGEHLSDEFQAKSPECTVPVLELDDGTSLWNSIAIRQYLESLHPEPALLGREALERARVTQYVLWIEHNGMMSAAEAFRNAAKGMADHALPGRRPVPQIDALAERGVRRFGHFLEDLDGFLDEQGYVAGDAFTVADIDALVMIDFGCRVTKAELEAHANLSKWYERVRNRPAIRAEG